MIKLVRGVRKARRTHATIAGVSDAQRRCRFFDMFSGNDTTSCSAAAQLFYHRVVAFNGSEQAVNARLTMLARRASSLQEQGLIGRGLKSDPGHLFGVTANLERGRRGAEGARR